MKKPRVKSKSHNVLKASLEIKAGMHQKAKQLKT